MDGVDLLTLTPQDWFFHAGTALYGYILKHCLTLKKNHVVFVFFRYGFGAPFVLGGPLGKAQDEMN